MNPEEQLLRIVQRLRKIELLVEKQESGFTSLKDDVRMIVGEVAKVQKFVGSGDGHGLKQRSNLGLASSKSIQMDVISDSERRNSAGKGGFFSFKGSNARRGSFFPSASFQPPSQPTKSVGASYLSLDIHDIPSVPQIIPPTHVKHIPKISDPTQWEIDSAPDQSDQIQLKVNDESREFFKDEDELGKGQQETVSAFAGKPLLLIEEQSGVDIANILASEESLNTDVPSNPPAQPQISTLERKPPLAPLAVKVPMNESEKNVQSSPVSQSSESRNLYPKKASLLTPNLFANAGASRRPSKMKALTKKVKHMFVDDKTVAPWIPESDESLEIENEDIDREIIAEERASEDTSLRGSQFNVSEQQDGTAITSPEFNKSLKRKMSIIKTTGNELDLTDAFVELQNFETERNKWWNRIFEGRYYKKELDRRRNKSGVANDKKPSMEKILRAILMIDFVIHPHSVFRHVWNTLQNVAHAVLFLALPVVVCFPEAHDYLYPLSIFTSAVFFMSIFFAMRTGYFSDGLLVMNSTRILRHYYNGWFFFDVSTAIPYIFIIDAIVGPNDENRYKYRLICLISGLRIIKLLTQKRPSWFDAIFKKLHRTMGVSFYFLATIKVLGAMAVYWHWSSCIMLWVNITTHDEEIHHNALENYTMGFYNSAAEMLAAGFGATEPRSMMRRWITIGNMIVSAVLLALLVGNVSAFMIGLDSSGRLFKEKIDEVNQYVTYKGLDSELRKRVIAYYEFKYSQSKYFDEDRILKELNPPLRKTIALHNCRALILRVPFFDNSGDIFISAIVNILQPVFFLENDFIIEEGTSGDEMYFISSGIVEVVINKEVLARLTPGMFFGEITLLFGRMKRTATIQAVTPCVLYSLSKRDLDEVLEQHPLMAERLKTVAEERLAKVTVNRKSD